MPIFWVVFAIGLILSLGGYLLSNTFEENSVRLEQKRATDLIADALSKRIDMKFDALMGIRGLFRASQKVDARDFAVFSRVYLDSQTDIQALEWIPRVSNDLRQVYRQEAMKSGRPDFLLREQDGDGNLVTAGERPEYFPVFYIEPLAGNAKAFGVDLASNNNFQAALKTASKRGSAIVSGSISPVQEAGSQSSFLAFVPVHSVSESTLKSNHLLGFALGVFHLKNVIEYALKGLQQETRHLSLFLVDSSNPLHSEMLYGQALSGIKHWQQKRSIEVAGRTWDVITEADDHYIAGKKGLTPYGVFLGIFLLTVLLAFHLRTLAQQNRKIHELVDKRTKDLEASETRSELIINEAADAVITIDSIGHISTINPAAVRMFGYSEEDVLGKNVNILMPEPYHSEHDGYLENHRKTGEKHIIGIGREVIGKRKDGSNFPLHLSVGKGVIDNQPVFIGILSDMTQRKRAEESLIAAKEMAEEASRQKSMFLNMMSHELRTPLTVILGYLPVLKDKDNMPAPEMIADIVSDMDLSGQHLLDLINDLLDISKIEAGQLDLSKTQINAKELVSQVAREFENQAQKSQIKLAVDIDDFTMNVDIKRFRQILINLVGNAMKFTSSGQITIRGLLQDTFAVFEVSDSGMGIPASDLPHIFDAFRQADSSSTREAGGTGLGLAITQCLVELHGGEIAVSSEPGKGSVFSFTIKQ